MFVGKYESITAEEACIEIVDCPHSTPKYDGEIQKYPAIRTSEIKNGDIDWKTMKYVGLEEYEKRTKRLKPRPGDVVYAREGLYGDCVVLPENHEFCLGQRTMLFRANQGICNPIYLYSALRSESVKKQADESNAGSTVPHVNVKDAKKFSFPLPPLNQQYQFEKLVNHITKSKFSKFRRVIDDLKSGPLCRIGLKI